MTEYKLVPVGRVKTAGGYPDESEHTVEWLCKYKDLKDGDLLYATPQPVEQQPTPNELSDYDRGFRDGKLDRLIDEVVVESELVEALEALLSVVAESHGVAGYHLNGDIAEWDEFIEVLDAEDALASYRKGGDHP